MPQSLRRSWIFVLLAIVVWSPLAAETWSPLTSGTTNYLNGVDFLNDQVGLVSGANATLLRTTNGGTNWSTSATVGLSTSNCCNDVKFFTDSEAFAGGIKAILRSTSGGASWGGTQFSGGTDFRNGISPVSSTTVWATGGTSGMRAFFRYTFDGANLSSTFWSTSSTDLMQDIQMFDADNGFAVGSNGRIIRITNGSAASPASPTFSIQSSGTTVQLNAIRMLSPQIGYVVGAGGTILKTTNGGTGWTPLPSGVTVNLEGLAFRDEMNGIVVGAAGTILVTTNGGLNWTPEASGVTADLRDVHYGAATTIAVGQNGTILKRSSGVPSCTYALAPSGTTVPSGGGTGTFGVTTTAGCAWGATSDSAWLRVTSGGSGSGSGTVGFTADPNPGAQRVGQITAGGQLFTVTQTASCTVTLSAAGAAFDSSGGAGNVGITTGTGCAWSASSDAPWLTITSSASGTGSGTLSYAVAANPTSSTRSAAVQVSGQTHTITQTGVPGCSFSFGSSSSSVPAAGGGGGVSVNTAAGCSWSAASDSAWLVLTTAGGTGPGTVSFTAAANATGLARVAHITLQGQTHTVSQPSSPQASAYGMWVLPPCRIHDTRFGSGGKMPGAAAQRNFAMTGQCGVPEDAKAVSVNITVTENGFGYIRVFPAGGNVPVVSSINYQAGTWALANGAIVPLGNAGSITLQTDGEPTHVIIDVNAYFK